MYYGKEINQYLELSAHPFTLLNVYFDENGVVILGRQPLEGSSKVATWTTPEKRLNKLVATELHVFEKSGYFCSIFQGNHRHTPFLNTSKSGYFFNTFMVAGVVGHYRFVEF